MTPGQSVDPYAHPCPACPAGAHEHCFVERTGRELPKPHAKRVKAAELAVARQRRRANADAEERLEPGRWRRLYVACRLELEQRGDWTTLAAEQLEALVRNMRLAEEARAAAEGKPFVEGSTGQTVAHPGTQTATRLDAQALAIASALKLTPDKRGTSAPRPGDEDIPADAGEETAAERDELAELDDLARKRKEKAERPAKRRRGGR
jgi:hypothetical protein